MSARDPRHRLLPFTLLALVAGFAAITPANAKPVETEHVTADLVLLDPEVRPGEPFHVGLKLQMEAGWHVYWRNPGDSGMPPAIKWELPKGFNAGEILWPYPELIEADPLASYGYHGTVVLPVQITPPAKLPPSVELKASAEWLVCKEVCLPGEADLVLALPQTPDADAAGFQEKLPVSSDRWEVAGEMQGDQVVLTIAAKAPPAVAPSRIHFFPYSDSLIDHAAAQTLEETPAGYRLVIPRSSLAEGEPSAIAGILVADTGWDAAGKYRALQFELPVAGARVEVAHEGPSAGTPVTTPLPVTPPAGFGLITALIFAFMGGIILNLMPCVLPVLSLKVFGFVQQAGESRRQVMAHAFIFAVGVILSFWVLAGTLIVLRAGGQQLGWGFQLQSPMFLVFLASFLFLFGLNMLGVFEIDTALTGVAGRAAGKGGMGGSFLNGVTATVVATPCTAPFMGSALGFSLSQPTWAVWLIFTMLGVGMALPYVVLASQPQLLKSLPKPGPWMETFKQLMGFVLLGTVIWLAWVLGTLTGSGGVVALLATFLILGMAGWIMGRWCHGGALRSERKIGTALAALLVAGGVAVGWAGAARSHPATGGPGEVAHRQGLLTWEPFTPERVAELQAAGTPVLIDFTADWCLTCKVNERVAFGSTEVQQRLVDLGVATLKADWTDKNESIARTLAGYGRNSVPVYILHPPGGDPVLLPEVLTPAIVLKALGGLERPQS
ncbi:MAG TPA: protein-disulfide reductase DsbD domain-containing protein [bacterium]|nr:protein-disulfide reductase DsbD domain-containing protein [bacterium]